MPQIGYSHRPVALGREGMVASAHPLATLAGVEVLKSGGTVADAAVAVNAVLAVTQPYCCGVGGDFFCLYYEAATRRVHFLNGAGRSGSRASLDELHHRGLADLPMAGPATVSVPGCVRAWAMLLERFGTRTLGELLAPAIHYAENGFPCTRLVSQAAEEMAPRFDDAEWHRIFVPGGRPPAQGRERVQPIAAAANVRQDEAHLGMPRRERRELDRVRSLLAGPVAAPVLPHVLQDRDAQLARQRADRVEQRIGGAATGRQLDADHAIGNATPDLGLGVRRVVGVHADVAADAVGMRILQREQRVVAVGQVVGRGEVHGRR